MIWVLILSVFLGLQPPAWAADAVNPLYAELSRAKEVKVHVQAPTDASSSGLDAEALRLALEKALRERKSIHFAPVASSGEAKLTVDAAVQGFTFSETDPVDMLVGAAAIALDAATVEHFASTEVDYTVKEGERVRWKGRVRSTLTDATMTESEARTRILDETAGDFVKTAFGKKLK